MWRPAWLVVCSIVLAGRAEASVDQWLGRLITDVRVQTLAGAVVDASVLELVETRLGEPFAMLQVRDTMDHLVGLGRYDDVRLSAEASADGAGVVLTWTLRPVERIVRTIATGGAGLEGDALRTVLDEEVGGPRPASRAPAMAAAMASFYQDRGYRTANVTPTLAQGREEGDVVLTLSIEPGARTTLTSASVKGLSNVPESRALSRLGLERGRPYDRVALEERLRAYENEIRADGHYLAQVREETTFSDAEHAAVVAVTVDLGPMVRVSYTGDPMSKDTLETLVPIAQERSADEDLLEDGSRKIEAYLRERGYRSASAPFSREERTGELLINFTITRGMLHRVNTVSLAGNVTQPASELEPLLKLPRGEAFVDARVTAVTNAIEELYRVRGYEAVAVKAGVEVLPEQADGGTRFRPVDVRFAVSEGPQTMVGTVVLAGVAESRNAAVHSVLGLVVGKPYYRPLIATDLDAIERWYRNQGFLSAIATPAVKLDETGRAVITWAVREGEQSRVDHVLITGNDRIRADVIRRELRLSQGDPLSVEAIAEGQQRISQLGLFRRVRIVDLPRTGTPLRDVLVTVEEAPATAVTYGGGLTVGRRLRAADNGGPAVERIEIAPRGFVELSRRNLWGKNRTLSFFARASLRPRDPAVDNPNPNDTGGYGLNDYRVTGTFREPRVFGRPGDGQLLAYIERGIRTSFTFDRRGFRADYARRFGQRLTTTARYQIENTDIIDEQIAPQDQLLVDRLFPQVRLSTFFGGILRDSRDDVLEPTLGTVLGVDGSVAARAYGSEVGFAKTFMQGFIYRKLPGRGFVVAGGARLGLAKAFAYEVPRVDEGGNPIFDDNGVQLSDIVTDLPAAERFFSGGDTTVRGFALDRLGTAETLDPQGFPQGGNGMLVLNVELRAPYWKGLGLVGFVDSGNVFRRASDVDLAELRVGTGFGVRYRSPIGPLRIDLGFKVHPKVLADGSRERGSSLYISLGQAF
ncbi:MAG TPA: POTRA domain-containing protein [Vicinamibacterales bacterium]|nr:POTRA domain-containing protein [Vicinamibacterales bacterium]